jgi:isoquinoline 1-oxidoreductase alpha subunit
MDGEAVRSCMVSVTTAAGRSILTIEGLAERSPDHPLFDAWQRLNVSQCGYCQPGQVMAAFALLAATPRPSADAVKQAIAGNLCRCGAYPRILAAILDAAEKSA